LLSAADDVRGPDHAFPRELPVLTPEQVTGLVSYIGIVMQLGGALLLAVLFYLLHRQARRRRWFTMWGFAWAFLCAAVAALAIRYNGLAGIGRTLLPEDSSAVQGLYFVYQWGKLLSCGLLVAGALFHSGGFKIRASTVGLVLLPGTSLYALATVGGAPSLDGIVFLQTPVMIVASGYCAWRLLAVPASRRTFGTRMTGGIFVTIAALWVVYAVGFRLAMMPDRPPVEPLAMLLRFNSYVDLLLQMLLGYGMVLMLIEESKREVDDARARLEVAHDQLRRDSYYDALTGAFNRRALTDGVGLEMARATYGSVVLLDLDNLKEANDGYGHEMGDRMLVLLARALRTGVRASDALYRLGGDEFLLVLPGSTPAEAARLVGRAVGAAIEQMDAECPGLRLGVSTGAAAYSGAEDLDDSIRRADAEMYRQKHGRKALLKGFQPA
jgi:diguanylate cyclase (GGDEF)-like protein